MRAMKSFIEEGDKVKVTLRFRGREMAHQDIGVRVLERIPLGDGPDDEGRADASAGKPPDGDGAVAEVGHGDEAWSLARSFGHFPRLCSFPPVIASSAPAGRPTLLMKLARRLAGWLNRRGRGWFPVGEAKQTSSGGTEIASLRLQ